MADDGRPISIPLIHTQSGAVLDPPDVEIARLRDSLAKLNQVRNKDRALLEESLEILELAGCDSWPDDCPGSTCARCDLTARLKARIEGKA